MVITAAYGRLWKLKIKLRLKIFIWKCINNTLPARENIFKRTQKGDPICKGCGNGVETTEHIFFHCSKAHLVWKLAPVQWDGASEHQGNFRSWWAEISKARCRKEGYDHIALTANILWQIWKARNSLEFGEKSKEAIKIIQKANSEWLEYDNVAKRSTQGSTTETNESQTTRIVEGKEEKSMQIKIATVKDKETGMLGIGVIASLENVVQAEWALKERSYNSNIIDEAMVIRLVLSKAISCHWTRVSVNVNNKQLLKWDS